MPYSGWEDAPSHVKKRGKKAAEKWISTWNSVFKKTGSESKAFAVANSVIASRAALEAAAMGMPSDVFGDWNAAGKYELEYIRTGWWEDFNGQGEIYVTNEDIADGIEAFRTWKEKDGWATNKRRPFLDWNHGITRPKMSARPNEAAGWMAEAWIVDLDGNKVEPEVARTSEAVLSIRVIYEVNADGNSDLEKKLFGLFSPTFIPSGTDDDGKDWKFQIVGGALTNVPFFEGLDPPMPLAASRRASVRFALEAIKARADSFLTIRVPVGTDGLDAKIAELEKLGFEVESFYQGPRGGVVGYAQRKSDDDGSEKKPDANGNNTNETVLPTFILGPAPEPQVFVRAKVPIE